MSDWRILVSQTSLFYNNKYLELAQAIDLDFLVNFHHGYHKNVVFALPL